MAAVKLEKLPEFTQFLAAFDALAEDADVSFDDLAYYSPDKLFELDNLSQPKKSHKIESARLKLAAKVFSVVAEAALDSTATQEKEIRRLAKKFNKHLFKKMGRILKQHSEKKKLSARIKQDFSAGVRDFFSDIIRYAGEDDVSPVHYTLEELLASEDLKGRDETVDKARMHLCMLIDRMRILKGEKSADKLSRELQIWYLKALLGLYAQNPLGKNEIIAKLDQLRKERRKKASPTKLFRSKFSKFQPIAGNTAALQPTVVKIYNSDQGLAKHKEDLRNAIARLDNADELVSKITIANRILLRARQLLSYAKERDYTDEVQSAQGLLLTYSDYRVMLEYHLYKEEKSTGQQASSCHLVNDTQAQISWQYRGDDLVQSLYDGLINYVCNTVPLQRLPKEDFSAEQFFQQLVNLVKEIVRGQPMANLDQITTHLEQKFSDLHRKLKQGDPDRFTRLHEVLRLPKLQVVLGDLNHILVNHEDDQMQYACSTLSVIFANFISTGSEIYREYNRSSNESLQEEYDPNSPYREQIESVLENMATGRLAVYVPSRQDLQNMQQKFSGNSEKEIAEDDIYFGSNEIMSPGFTPPGSP